MTRRLTCLLLGLILVAAAGCGESEEPTTTGPAEATFTAPRQEEPANSEPECEPAPEQKPITRGRDVRVAGLDAEPTRRPRALEVARDVRLDCLIWTRFGRGTAKATGRATVLDCVPSCAQSGTSRQAARLEVSGLQRCRGRRYYSEAELVVGGEEPRAVLRSPCDAAPGAR